MIYFDNSATEKPSKAAVDAATRAMCELWGNPSSVHHTGVEAARLLADSRAVLSSCLGGKIIFTSGGSEANNLAIIGCARSKSARGKILISDGEHPSVENAAESLTADGFSIVRIPTKNGVLDLDAIKRESADGNVISAAFMLVNNETGAIYDIKRAIATIRAFSPRAVIHVDAVQAFMKLPLSLSSLKADTIAISGHKIGAPKGIGALAVSEELIKKRRLSPLIFGGGQEDGYRSGTENMPAIAAIAAAVKESKAAISKHREICKELRGLLEVEISALDVRINCPLGEYLPSIINITLPNIKSETMVNAMSRRGIAISAGSACASHGHGASRALIAFGLTEREADSSIRISLNHNNTADEVRAFAAALSEELLHLQRF